PQIRDQPAEQDGQRIWFLTRRTAGAPDPQALILPPPGGDQFGQDFGFENVEAFLLPEEIGFADRQMAGEYVLLLPCELSGEQQVYAPIPVLKPQFLSDMADDPFEIAPALFGEMQAEPAGNVFAEPGQLPVGNLAGHGFL